MNNFKKSKKIKWIYLLILLSIIIIFSVAKINLISAKSNNFYNEIKISQKNKNDIQLATKNKLINQFNSNKTPLINNINLEKKYNLFKNPNIKTKVKAVPDRHGGFWMVDSEMIPNAYHIRSDGKIKKIPIISNHHYPTDLITDKEGNAIVTPRSSGTVIKIDYKSDKISLSGNPFIYKGLSHIVSDGANGYWGKALMYPDVKIGKLDENFNSKDLIWGYMISDLVSNGSGGFVTIEGIDSDKIVNYDIISPYIHHTHTKKITDGLKMLESIDKKVYFVTNKNQIGYLPQNFNGISKTNIF